jgi:uncharacterized protein (TIGR04255 family)
VTQIVSNWLELPVQPRVVFERTPLALVICQVRFSTMLSVNDPKAVAPFQLAIQGDYPVAAPMAQQKVGLSIGPEGAQFSLPSHPLPTPVWKFSDLSDDWTVVLTSDSIVLETRAYADFHDFLHKLRRVLDALESTIRPTICTRIGLRYINEVRPKNRDWASVVRAEFLGPLAIAQFKSRAVQSTQQLLLHGPGGERVHVQHGLIPTGSAVEPKPGVAPNEDPYYLLDMDAFVEYSRPDLLPADPIKVCEVVTSLNTTTSALFRWAITGSFAATLGVSANADR